MIEAHELTRKYGDFTAVAGVSFTVPEGEIVGMLGPNGAGKTTILRMLTGFLPPTSGRVTLNGKDLAADPVAARRDLGYLPENVALYPELRVEEFLAYRARLEGMDRARRERAIGEVLARCLLVDVRRQVIGTLSKGFKQRVGLAAAILHGPKVVILDEPTVGLDPKQIIAIRELIRELGEKHTLLLSTHILPEVELLCRRVLIVDRGRVVAEGTPEALRQRWLGRRQVRVGFESEPSGAQQALAALAGVTGVERAGEAEFVLECGEGVDPRAEIFRLAVERGFTLVELTQEKASLEDIFVRLTTREIDAEETSAPEAA